jgi:hypothetical protein
VAPLLVRLAGCVDFRFKLSTSIGA